MDHRYVEEHNVADQYVLGQLSAEQEARFEAHFITCQECLDQLELTEHFRRDLKLVMPEAVGRSPMYAQPAARGWRWRLAPRWPAALAVAAVVLAAALPSMFFLREIQRQRAEVEQARLTARTLEQRLRETEQKAARSQQRLRTEIEREQRARAEAANELARLTRPQVNTPLFTLSALRGDEPPSAPPDQILLSSAAGWIVFSLELAPEPAYQTYRVTMRTRDGQAVWTQSHLKLSRQADLTIAFHSSFFREGDYRITVEGRASEGRFVPAARYAFRVIKKG
jgi:hypothetical protein